MAGHNWRRGLLFGFSNVRQPRPGAVLVIGVSRDGGDADAGLPLYELAPAPLWSA